MDLGRIQGYLARDMEIVVGRAVEQVVSNVTAPLLARIEEQSDLLEAQTAQIEQLAAAQALLLEGIERLTMGQAPILEHIAQLTAAQKAAEAAQAGAQTAYTEAQASLAGRLEAQAVTQRLLMDQLKQLRKDRAPETAGIAVLSAEITQLRKAQQTPSAGTQTAVEEAVDKSLVPYLKQVRKVAQEVDRVEGENKRLKADLEEAQSKVAQTEAARRPWWKFW
jgi:chromosome segregation ATPase